MSNEGGLHEPKDPETEDFVSSSSLGLFQMILFAPKMTHGFVFDSGAWKKGEEGKPWEGWGAKAVDGVGVPMMLRKDNQGALGLLPGHRGSRKAGSGPREDRD